MYPAFHLSLNTPDLARARAFYEKLFGPPVKDKPGYLKFVFDRPGLHLALNEVPGLAPGGSLSHLGIRVASSGEVAAWRQAAVARGLSVEDEKGVDCCHAKQDKFWVADPDGNRWEVYTVLADLEPGATDGASACCATAATPSAAAAKPSCCNQDGPGGACTCVCCAPAPRSGATSAAACCAR